MDFLCLMFSSQKFPKGLFYLFLNGIRYCFNLGEFSLHAKLFKPILHDQVAYKGILKIFEIFQMPLFFFFLFFSFLCCFFNSQRAFPPSFFPPRTAQPTWALLLMSP